MPKRYARGFRRVVWFEAAGDPPAGATAGERLLHMTGRVQN